MRAVVRRARPAWRAGHPRAADTPPRRVGSSSGSGRSGSTARSCTPGSAWRRRHVPAGARNRSGRGGRPVPWRRVPGRSAGGRDDGRDGPRVRRRLRRVHLRPAGQVIAFRSDLDWATLGAFPEMLQTSYGSLTIGLDARPGQSILIRGGTSSVGMATAVLAKQRGMTVLATTRSPAKRAALAGIGVDHVLIDDGTSPGRSTLFSAAGLTPRSNWSAPPPSPTPCERPASTESSASPGCCPTSGPSATSTPSTTSPGVA